MFTKNPVRSDGKPLSENQTSARVRSVSNVVLVLDKHAFFVFGVCAVGSEEGKEVFTKNPVRSDGKPRSENQTSARVRSVLNVVSVLDKHGLCLFCVCYLERGNEVFTKNPVRSDGKPRSEN